MIPNAQLVAEKDAKKMDISAVESWVFDLDNTIYPASSELFSRVTDRMVLFIMDYFGIDQNKAEALKTQLFRKYGTTMNGLITEHGMSPDKFLAYVHEIDLHDVSYDEELDRGIAALPGRKFIYTNGTVRHAARILEAFGISHHFDSIFDIVASGMLPKPHPDPYQTFITQSQINPHTCVMIEDMASNLKPASKLGMQTVWLVNDHDWGAKGAEQDFVHFIAADLKAFLASMPK